MTHANITKRLAIEMAEHVALAFSWVMLLWMMHINKQAIRCMHDLASLLKAIEEPDDYDEPEAVDHCKECGDDKDLA